MRLDAWLMLGVALAGVAFGGCDTDDCREEVNGYCDGETFVKCASKSPNFVLSREDCQVACRSDDRGAACVASEQPDCLRQSGPANGEVCDGDAIVKCRFGYTLAEPPVRTCDRCGEVREWRGWEAKCTGPLGAPCGANVDCFDEYVCRIGYMAVWGTCEERDYGDECVSGDHCLPQYACRGGRCIGPGTLGAECDEYKCYECDVCVGGAVCRPSPSPGKDTCQAPGSFGGRCSLDDDCAFGLRCGEDSSGESECQAPGRLGEPCWSRDPVQCVDGLVCRGKKGMSGRACQELGEEGEACYESEDCQRGLECLWVEEYEYECR